MRSLPWLPLLLLLSIAPARAQGPRPVQDPYARFIDRADVVVLGRVLEGGIREVPDGAGGVTAQASVRVSVERWIAGPDTSRTLEVKLSPYDPFLDELGKAASQPDRRVILYLARVRETWWLVREVAAPADRPVVGIEILATGEALARVPSIRREAEAASPDSLAARADLVVVGTLDRLDSKPPKRICRVERVLSGTPAGDTLTVVTDTPQDLHHGRALLLLAAESNGTWKVLHDGAGCYYLDLDRVAHSTAPAESVFARIAAAHARRGGGDGR